MKKQLRILFAAKLMAIVGACMLGPLGMLGSVGWAAGPLAIQGGKIITISGDTLDVGTIIIREGKIAAVGKDVKIPGEAKVIDASGKVIMPGYVDAHNSAAMSQPNERTEVVPFLSVVDSIDPVADYFEECRRNGITSAAVVPGNSTLIGGQAAVLKTAGGYVNDMLLRRESGLKLSLKPTSGSRMSQMARLRKELDKAKKAIEDEEDEEDEEGSKDSKPAAKSEDKDAKEDASEEASSDEEKQEVETAEDKGLKALKQAVSGELPVYIYCENGMDVVAALALVKDYGLNPIFVLGRDCYKAAELLGKRGETVILDPTLVFWETDPRTREDKKIVLPEIYQEAGVPFIFQTEDSGSRTSLGTSYFWFQAATAVKYGMSEAKALESLTLAPAKLIGIDNLVGSIEVGKDADLVILTGEPFDISTWVEKTIVDGEVVYDRADDEKLKRLLSPVAE